MRTMLKSKLHGATVTEANVDYEGSITIDPKLMKSADLLPYEQVHVLDHQSGEILSTFGRPGHQAGNFTHGHTIAVDSVGNMYVAETATGRRVQKFRPVN